MDMLTQLNGAVAYIEANLRGDIDWDRAARIACLTYDSLARVFSYLVGMSLAEYARKRRLTLAAAELRASGARVLDVAVAYGWDSADAFTRAFVRQHGVTPAKARDERAQLRVYPPASFYIAVKGARKMNMRMVDFEGADVYGVSSPYEGGDREAVRHALWSEDCGDAPGRICARDYDGVWYGVWRDGRYWVARGAKDARRESPENANTPTDYARGESLECTNAPDGRDQFADSAKVVRSESLESTNARAESLEKTTIPAGRYAAFTTEPGGLAWVELPRLMDLIFDSWLPGSGYRLSGEHIVEVYHLWTDRDERRAKRYYEIWIPIAREGKQNEALVSGGIRV